MVQLQGILVQVAVLLSYYGLADLKQCGNTTYEVYKAGVTPEDVATILELHNQKRQQVASGNCTSKSGEHLPKACNMIKMVWDDGLAAWAQIHADGCLFEHWNPALENRTYYGQNLFIKYSSSKDLMDKPDWEWAIGYWNDESDLFDLKHRKPYKFTHETGHFTQVVWAKTYKVGCGAAWFVNTTDTVHPYRTLYTCQYWPGGNYLSRSMYATENCNECVLDEAYPNLCFLH